MPVIFPVAFAGLAQPDPQGVLEPNQREDRQQDNEKYGTTGRTSSPCRRSWPRSSRRCKRGRAAASETNVISRTRMPKAQRVTAVHCWPLPAQWGPPASPNHQPQHHNNTPITRNPQNTTIPNWRNSSVVGSRLIGNMVTPSSRTPGLRGRDSASQTSTDPEYTYHSRPMAAIPTPPSCMARCGFVAESAVAVVIPTATVRSRGGIWPRSRRTRRSAARSLGRPPPAYSVGMTIPVGQTIRNHRARHAP